jgi:hypothetical protein
MLLKLLKVRKVLETKIDKDLLRKLDDFASLLTQSGEKHYGQMLRESLPCEGCYIIVKNIYNGSIVFQRSESHAVIHNSSSDSDLENLYIEELLNKYTGSPHSIIHNQDPLFTRFPKKMQKMFKSVSIVLTIDGVEIGILSCI